MSANTSTIDLIDDFIPVDDQHEAKTRSRRSSAIHIKVYRIGTGCSSDVTAGGLIPVDTGTSESFASAPQPEPVEIKSRRKSKKKPPSSKVQPS